MKEVGRLLLDQEYRVPVRITHQETFAKTGLLVRHGHDRGRDESHVQIEPTNAEPKVRAGLMLMPE